MWDVISSDVPDLGVYEWVIPEITSSRSILKIESSTNPNVFIQTEKYIRLTAEPLILIDAPIINDKWTVLDSDCKTFVMILLYHNL